MIDFGNGISATLKAGTFNLGANTLSITNWVNGADYFYATQVILGCMAAYFLLHALFGKKRTPEGEAAQ